MKLLILVFSLTILPALGGSFGRKEFSQVAAVLRDGNSIGLRKFFSVKVASDFF